MMALIAGPNAEINRRSVARGGQRKPFSIRERWVRPIPAARANFSWLMPRLERKLRMVVPIRAGSARTAASGCPTRSLKGSLILMHSTFRARPQRLHC